MKYKVGDKVRIVSEWTSMMAVNPYGKMDKWLGKTMTIKAITDNYYKMKEDNGEFEGAGWDWFDYHISGLSTEFTKSDLQNGDVVLFKNNEVGIYNETLDMFIVTDGWVDTGNIGNDLTCRVSKKYDIIAVRRPLKKFECRFQAFENSDGELVYERKEIEEMTLEEVCRLLGKEIKIVKGK